VRNSVLPGWLCQARDDEFLQISSDGFRLAPWTFPGIRRNITLTCRICPPLLSKKLSESGGTSKWGVRETGKVPEPLKHQAGFGHVTPLQETNHPTKIR